jgi:hypothetical protein
LSNSIKLVCTVFDIVFAIFRKAIKFLLQKMQLFAKVTNFFCEKCKCWVVWV